MSDAPESGYDWKRTNYFQSSNIIPTEYRPATKSDHTVNKIYATGMLVTIAEKYSSTYGESRVVFSSNGNVSLITQYAGSVLERHASATWVTE